MSKILANQIANYGDDSPIELKEGLNIPDGKPLQAAGASGSNGQVLTSTGTTVQWTTPFDGDYGSLTNPPTIPAAQVNSDWNAVGTVAEILNKPLVPPLPSVTVAEPGSSSLSYNSTSGLFTYIPPDLSEYATEAWVGSQGYLTSYTETDTLDSVTGRGSSTTNAITVNGLTVSNDGAPNGSFNISDTGSYTQLTFYNSSGTSGSNIQGVETNIYVNAPGHVRLAGQGTIFYGNGNIELNATSPVNSTTTFFNGFTVSGGDLACGSANLTTTGKLYYSNNFATTVDLPSASTYHGMFAHVHAEDHGYFAHAGAWTQLLDTGSELGDLANVNFATAPQTGQVLKYDGSNWVAAADGTGGGGIALSDLSVSTASAGSAALTYNNVSGVFTFTPPDLSSYLTSVAINDVSDVNITSLADTEILRYNSVSGNWENWAPNYLTSYTETDPVFVASPAGSITNADINQWDTAYGWGNHANGGYLVATAQDKTNWNTAYGWGDHAAAGYSTLPSQATNVVIGDATTGDAITTASDNVVIGSNAGSAITTKTNNVFIGHNAGAEDIGSYNVAIGPDAGDTSYGEFQNVENTAVGRLAGDLRNGNGNTVLGFASLSYSATSGFSFGNIALGYYAMGNYKIDGASYNTFIGQQTGWSLTSGDANVFLGDYAGYGITTGSNNILIEPLQVTTSLLVITMLLSMVVTIKMAQHQVLLLTQVILYGLDTPVMHGLRELVLEIQEL